ncbi:MAG: hypothetical protein ACYC99_05670 [Candidatus Geothermincolia bacterium]
MEPADTGASTATPDSPEAAYAAMKELFQKKRHAEIVALCERLESTGKYDANTVAVHSASLLRLNRSKDAIALLEGMLYYFPNDARLHMNLGTAYNATLRRREAKYEYDLARKLDPVVVGQKVTRIMILRIVIASVAFALFFVALIFWPHTRWMLVALSGLMLAVSLLVIYTAMKSKVKARMVTSILMIAFWIALLLLSIFAPAHW